MGYDSLKSKVTSSFAQVYKHAKKAAIAATFAVASVLPVYANDTSPPHPFATKTFEVETNSATTTVSVVGFDDYSKVASLDDAIETVDSGYSPSVLLVGTFSDSEVRDVEGILKNLYEINPEALKTLEPVIVKLKSGHTSAASSNSFSKRNFNRVFSYLGKSFEKDVERDKTYTQTVERLCENLVVVPADATAYSEALKKIDAFHSPKKDQFDIVLSGIEGGHFRHTIAHELGHLIINETKEGYFDVIKELLDFPVFHPPKRSRHDIGYIMFRQAEVLQWKHQKMTEFDFVLGFYDTLPDISQKVISDTLSKVPQTSREIQFVSQIFAARKTTDSVTLRKRFERIIDLSSSDFFTAERIAEDIADILLKNASYHSAMDDLAGFDVSGMHEILEQEREYQEPMPLIPLADQLEKEFQRKKAVEALKQSLYNIPGYELILIERYLKRIKKVRKASF